MSYWVKNQPVTGHTSVYPVPNHLQLESQVKRIACADLHDGTRIDIPSIFLDFGHDVLNLGSKGRNGPYPIPLNRMTYPTREISSVILSYNSHSTRLTESMVKEIFEYYKDDPDILQTDAFLCQFPPALCELFIAFNRTIIINASHRLFLGRCSQVEAESFVEHLQKLSLGLTGTRHFLSASNVYDAEYIKYFTGLEVPVIGGSSFGYQFCQYAPVRPEIIVGPLQLIDIPQFFNSSKFEFRTMKSLYSTYQVEDMCKHRAFVIMPYAVHSYGILEPYSLSIPMFAPSIEFALRETMFHDKNTNDEHYCGDQFHEPSWNSGSQPFSPEDRSLNAQRHWLQFADIYQLPNIQLFDNLEQLEELLINTDFDTIHKRMLDFNRRKRHRVYSQIHELASGISTRSNIPPTYADAVRLWGGSISPA